MLTRITMVTAVAISLTPMLAFAQADADKVNQLIETMGLPDMLEIMQAEGLEYGDQIAVDLFPNRTAPEWSKDVAGIYALDAMTETVRSGLIDALDGTDIDAMIAFFSSEPGQTIIALEISAREALMDDDVEEASKMAAAMALAEETPRADLVTAYVESNDLVETNVVGAMNANYAFYIGLMDGGAFGQGLSEDQILADVWSQEAEIRQNTSEWVYSYLMMAYQPLSDADLETYISFSQSEVGQDLNDGLFAAFDAMFEDISGALGRAASDYMIGQDL